jgi:hercynylcysteine S-oxide lyase
MELQEYERQVVTVLPFGEQQPLNAAADDAGVVFESVTAHPPEETFHVKAQVYVWNKPPQETLDPVIWSYDTFLKDNLHKWVGSEAHRDSYADVDKARELVGMDQSIVAQRMQKNGSASPQDLKSPGKDREYIFGHPMLKYFCFEDGYINLNNGRFLCEILSSL